MFEAGPGHLFEETAHFHGTALAGRGHPANAAGAVPPFRELPMTNPLSLRQLGQIAVAMLESDPYATVVSVADRVGISEPTVYRYWSEAHPDEPPRGGPVHFDRLCDVVFARIIEPSTFGELYAATRARIPGLHERTMHRALRRLIDDGRVVRVGLKCSVNSTYQRSKP